MRPESFLRRYLNREHKTRFAAGGQKRAANVRAFRARYTGNRTGWENLA